MRVITSVHVKAWQMAMLALAVSTRLSFRAAMKSVSVREVSYKHRGFLISVAHRLPLHHPPPRYVYFLMLYIICFTSNLSYRSLTIIPISSSFVHKAHRRAYCKSGNVQPHYVKSKYGQPHYVKSGQGVFWQVQKVRLGFQG